MADQFHSPLSELSPNSGFPDTYPEAVDDSESIRSDIYRGSEPPSPGAGILPHSNPPSIASTSSSFWGRLGGFAQVVSAVENALSRWGGSSGSSSSSSSSDSSTPRLQLKLRRNKRYPGSVYSLQSDLDFAARLSLIKARAVSRHTARHFILYIPPSANTPPEFSSSDSLQNVLQELEVLLRKTSRARKLKDREDAATSQQPPSDVNGQRLAHHHFMLPFPDLVPPSRAASFADLSGLHSSKKGKDRLQEPSVLISSSQAKAATPAWFLDVASPTWDDMRAIGRLLHLHPLTLEDILQKEPREKLEIFPKLGYSFISFRTMKIRGGNPLGGILNIHNDDDQEPILAETNIYLIIFNEGVCLFHFTDISEHIERVRNRMLSFAQSSTMTSAWIAHGVLDSIVDSFFPCLEAVEREVVAIEELVFEGQRDTSAPRKPLNSHKPPENLTEEPEKIHTFHEKEKASIREEFVLKPRFQLPRPPVTSVQKRIKRFLRSYFKPTQRDKPTPVNTTSVNLKRIATTRKLVTSLGRILTSKADVIAQIQKRVLSGLAGYGTAEDVEVAIYMGDVQDHILTLQHSLAHYERMLSHSYPVYQSTLRTQLSMTKTGTDKAIMVLTVVSISVLCGQTVIGLFSMNIKVPANVKEPGYPFNVFGIVLALVIVALSIFATLVRWWWRKAKRRRGLALNR